MSARAGRNHRFWITNILGIGLLCGNTGCMSYAVKGCRPASSPGKVMEQHFTVTRVESAVQPECGAGPFACTKGMANLDAKRDVLSEILCRERPDLFVESGGVPFGVVAAITKVDWPGKRVGTWALYILTVGCWPVSLEGRLSGDVYLYTQRQPDRAIVRSTLLCGYKGNVSVFTPIGLFPRVNGFPDFYGEETCGAISPTPDTKTTEIVFLTEMARSIASAMTPHVQEKMVAPDAPKPDALQASTSGEQGYVDVIASDADIKFGSRPIFYFVAGNLSAPMPITPGWGARIPLAPGSYMFASEPSGDAAITVQVAVRRLTVVTVAGYQIKGSLPMSRNDAEMFKIRFWNKTAKMGQTGGRAAFEREVQNAIDQGKLNSKDLKATYPDGTTHQFNTH